MFVRLTLISSQDSEERIQNVRNYNTLDIEWFGKCKEGTEVKIRTGARFLVEESPADIYRQLHDQRKR